MYGERLYWEWMGEGGGLGHGKVGAGFFMNIGVRIPAIRD